MIQLCPTSLSRPSFHAARLVTSLLSPHSEECLPRPTALMQILPFLQRQVGGNFFEVFSDYLT